GLEQLLYALRRQLHPSLVLGIDPLRLDANTITSDVASFDEACERGELSAAVALYRGPFLDGFYIGDSAEFERWTDTERARLAERYVGALEHLGRQASADGDTRAAIETWRRLVAVDPMSSRATLGLMTALAEAGEAAEAIRQGRAYEALVRGEGAKPTAAIEEQLRRLLAEPRESAGPMPPAAGHAPSTPARAVPVVIARPATRLSRRALAVTAAGLTMLSVALGQRVLSHRPSSRRAAPVGVRSIAVLPLRNLSGDSAQEYFADGITDALITDLGKIAGLRVISRTSSMHYKGTHETLPAIARQLDVDAIVEGSVLRAGSRVRVTAQLVEASSDRHLWAETYERDLRDVLELEDAVARAITNEVQVRVASVSHGSLASGRVRPVDPEAYDSYLRGRSEWNSWTEQSVTSSIVHFERAIQLDSQYAPAWAGLSDAYMGLGGAGVLPTQVAWPKAKAAALRAIQLDDSLSEAHASLAMALAHVDWSWSAAETEFRRAIALDPNNAHAHQMYGEVLEAAGQFDAAIAERRRALLLDPLSPNKQNTLAASLYRAGRYDEALQYFLSVPDPDFISENRHRRIAAIYERRGRLADAMAEWLTALRLSGKQQAVASVEHAYQSSGYAAARRVFLQRDLQEVLRRAQKGYPRPRSLDVAADYALLGDRDRAMAWIDKAAREREWPVMFLSVDDRFEALRSDPRFREVERRIGLIGA
ncbi:MAG: tetratricopeptide repeat protein, partial [Gemmatimonadota bacterium]|nr:tetratricopeptide repeat protein [Gemmatimonadota bacterium]